MGFLTALCHSLNPHGTTPTPDRSSRRRDLPCWRPHRMTSTPMPRTEALLRAVVGAYLTMGNVGVSYVRTSIPRAASDDDTLSRCAACRRSLVRRNTCRPRASPTLAAKNDYLSHAEPQLRLIGVTLSPPWPWRRDGRPDFLPACRRLPPGLVHHSKMGTTSTGTAQRANAAAEPTKGISARRNARMVASRKRLADLGLF